MKKSLAIIAAAVLAIGTSVCAQTVLQDFEAGTNGTALPGNWLPTFSGSTAGVATDASVYSNEQFVGGALSGKVSWDWTGASAGFVRIQPAAAGLNNNTAVDRTATPFIGMAIYASGGGDEFQYYMGEGSNGASPYEAFTAKYTLSFTGWRVVERNVLTNTVVSWAATGDGVLNPICSLSGLMWRQLAAAVPVAYYVDDITFTAATRNPTLQPDAAAGVNDWSVY